jgi:hypothetical protein
VWLPHARAHARKAPVDSAADASATSLSLRPAGPKPPLVYGPDAAVTFAASARVSRCAAAFAASPAAALAPFRHRLRRLRPGSRQAMPSERRRLHRELGRAAFLTSERPHRALFPRAASRAPVRFSPHLLPLHRPFAPPSCRRSGVVARARTGVARTLAPRPSWARLGRAHAAQAEAKPSQARPCARRASGPRRC